tara:strand:+ start:177 stop:803 length:627 start_codon:yes stop_codon:yes gene_type:complete
MSEPKFGRGTERSHVYVAPAPPPPVYTVHVPAAPDNNNGGDDRSPQPLYSYSVGNTWYNSYDMQSANTAAFHTSGPLSTNSTAQNVVDNRDSGSDDGGGGSHCCTAAYKKGNMSLTEVKKLRAWHRNKNIFWQEGYDVWGKVIADNLISKSEWCRLRTRDFYYHKIYNKRTMGSILADIVICPMSYIIGIFKVLKNKIEIMEIKNYGN